MCTKRKHVPVVEVLIGSVFRRIISLVSIRIIYSYNPISFREVPDQALPKEANDSDTSPRNNQRWRIISVVY